MVATEETAVRELVGGKLKSAFDFFLRYLVTLQATLLLKLKATAQVTDVSNFQVLLGQHKALVLGSVDENKCRLTGSPWLFIPPPFL